MTGQGEVSSPPYPFAPPPRSSSSLQYRLTAGGLRRAAVSGPSLSISFGGVDPHPVLLPWMPVLPPFLFSSCLDFRSSVLGAIVVASLDFWLNLGLSRSEKATRLFGLVFGRSMFEFGRPVVPDLTTTVGNCRFPVSSGTTAPIGAVLLLERCCRFRVTILPLLAQFHHVPAISRSHLLWLMAYA